MVCFNGGKDPLLSSATDCVTEKDSDDYVIDGGNSDAWLETHVIAGFRVWQILLLAGTILTTIVTFLCCCIRFRIPRTKQEIESDWERREMAREFERRMKRIIGHEEGSKLDLRKGIARNKALERVHADVVREEEEKRKREKEEEVRIRIRDGVCEGNESRRGRRKAGGQDANSKQSGAESEGRGSHTNLGWKTTGVIARVFFSGHRREKS